MPRLQQCWALIGAVAVGPGHKATFDPSTLAAAMELRPGAEHPLAADPPTHRGARRMMGLNLSRYALSSCVAAAMLAGCGGSQPPIRRYEFLGKCR
jgi:hypothetical protein